MGHIPIIPYARSRRTPVASFDPSKRCSFTSESPVMSVFRRNTYDSLMILFPVTVVMVICAIVHGIAQGW